MGKEVISLLPCTLVISAAPEITEQIDIAIRQLGHRMVERRGRSLLNHG